MRVSFDTAKIEIRVKKTSDDLADLTEGDIKASIDLKGMSEGSYEVPVSIEIPKGYELVDEVTTGWRFPKFLQQMKAINRRFQNGKSEDNSQ